MIDDRLTDEIETTAKAFPRYSTEVVTTDGGWEVRNSRWAYPLHRFEFNITPGFQGSGDALDIFVDLFYAAGGMAETFKFKHWADYQGSGEYIGTGNGSSQDFQLVKNYTRGAVNRTRKITRPVNGTVVIYFDGIPTGSYTLDYETGIVTASPANGVLVHADFEFDIPVRFADDECEFVAITGELQQPVNISVVEVRE
jgi:uncharacterized protein (TIGR02217 family)